MINEHFRYQPHRFTWCYALGYVGMKAGEHWADLKVYFHQSHYVIGALGLVFIAWYMHRHFKHSD